MKSITHKLQRFECTYTKCILTNRINISFNDRKSVRKYIHFSCEVLILDYKSFRRQKVLHSSTLYIRRLLNNTQYFLVWCCLGLGQKWFPSIYCNLQCKSFRIIVIEWKYSKSRKRSTWQDYQFCHLHVWTPKPPASEPLIRVPPTDKTIREVEVRRVRSANSRVWLQHRSLAKVK